MQSVVGQTIHKRHGKHFRYSHLKNIHTQKVEHGLTEIKRLPDGDTLVVNTDYSTGRMKGQNIHRNKKYSTKATFISTKSDSIIIDTVLTSSLICQRLEAPVVGALQKSETVSVTPIINTAPEYSSMIHVDFDGMFLNNANWGNPIQLLASNQSAAQKRVTMRYMDIHYKPFTINFSTDSNLYNATNPKNKFRCMITPTNIQGGAGGVSYTGVWDNSGAWQAYSPNFAFEGSLGNNPIFIGAAACHECGHLLNGCAHNGIYTASCIFSSGYYDHKGSGQTSTCGIMGEGYYSNINEWWYGSMNSPVCNDSAQNCLKIITGAYGVTYRADMVGNTIATARPESWNNNFFSDSSIIERTGDIDIFTIPVNGKIKVIVKPESTDTATNANAMLKVKLRLLDANGNQLAIDTPINRLDGNLTLNYSGVIGIEVSGMGTNNNVDYGYKYNRSQGSIGGYTVYATQANGSTTNPCTNFAISVTPQNSSICTGHVLMLSANSVNGQVPFNYVWLPMNVVGQTLSVTPTVNSTYQAFVTDAKGCTANALATVTVLPLPQIQVTPQNPKICQNNSMTISVSGTATKYTWLPSLGLSSTSGNSITASTSITTTYTVTGLSVNGCTASTSLIVTVTPNPQISINTSNPNPVCKNSNVTLSASGASSYKWSVGSSGNPLTVSPSTATTYQVTGIDGNGCTGTASYQVTVKDCPTQIPVMQASGFVTSSTTTTIAFNSNGSSSYTLSITPLPGDPIPAVNCSQACRFDLTGLKSKTIYTFFINGGKVFIFKTK